MIKKIGYWVFSFLLVVSPSTLATSWDIFDWEFSEDTSFRSAVEQVTDLKNSITLFKNKLSEMDEASKDKHQWTLDDQYKEVRTEMVKVIQDYTIFGN